MPRHRSTNNVLDSFQPLGSGITFYKPFKPTASAVGPSLIIIATWFNALPRHVSKYTSKYREIFPDAAILLVPATTPDMVYRKYSTQQRNLQPALSVLLECQPPEHEILFHIFSNSGAHMACQLARAYRNQNASALSVGALILDSAPGINSYQNLTNGTVAGLPSTPVLKQLLSIVVYGVVGLITVKEGITREVNFIKRFRRDLNDEQLLRSARGRVYIYSKNDKIVGWRDVESHAKEAERVGEVGVALWEGSGHVGHMSSDSERYWEIVQNLWAGEPKLKCKL